MYAFVYRRIIMRQLIQTKPKPNKQNKQTTQKKNHSLCHMYKSLRFPLYLCNLWELPFWSVFQSILVRNLWENAGDHCIVCIIWREKLIIPICMDIRYSAMDEPYVFSSEVRNCKYYPQVFRHVQSNGHNMLKLGSL